MNLAPLPHVAQAAQHLQRLTDIQAEFRQELLAANLLATEGAAGAASSSLEAFVPRVEGAVGSTAGAASSSLGGAPAEAPGVAPPQPAPAQLAGDGLQGLHILRDHLVDAIDVAVAMLAALPQVARYMQEAKNFLATDLPTFRKLVKAYDVLRLGRQSVAKSHQLAAGKQVKYVALLCRELLILKRCIIGEIGVLTSDGLKAMLEEEIFKRPLEAPLVSEMALSCSNVMIVARRDAEFKRSLDTSTPPAIPMKVHGFDFADKTLNGIYRYVSEECGRCIYENESNDKGHQISFDFLKQCWVIRDIYLERNDKR